MQRFILAILSITILFSLGTPVMAAKIRVRKPVGTRVAGTSFSSATLSRNTNSVLLRLKNLGTASNVTYELSYLANGIPQGAMGTITTTGQVTDSRDLYFGTCSHGVCTPHYNISNAIIIVTTTLNNGGTNIKRYKIKI